MARSHNPREVLQNRSEREPNTVLFGACVLVLVLVPLVFSTAVFRIYVLPKLLVLLLGATAVATLTAVAVVGRSRGELIGLLRSRLVLLVTVYIAVVALSTLLGISPLSSLMGSNPIAMGLVTRLCFFAVFLGLIVSAAHSKARLSVVLWAMALAGLAASAYACLQFFGRDPFLPASSYTFDSAEGGVLRVPGTLGHSNYLGNFLLYTTPLSAGLALSSGGRARRIALAGAALSVAAIAFSGTRGAWLGAFAGALTFSLLETRSANRYALKANKRLVLRTTAAAAIILFAVATIALTPASRSIITRARSFVAEGFTGAGRTLLWRDSATMVPRYALTGCGPEAFGKAFLPYKSKELAHFAPQINNESSHNSYIDAAITFGLPGAALYAALIASAFALLMKARRRVVSSRERFVVTGLVSSIAGVAVHNFFIYDQIPTGLYFFAFLALAVIVSRQASSTGNRKESETAPSSNSRSGRRLIWAVGAIGLCVFLLASWYAISIARADIAIKKAFHSAADRDFSGLVENGELAAGAPDPTGAYSFLFARALGRYVDAVKTNPRAQNESAGKDGNPLRTQAIEMAITRARSSLAHSLTPESHYVLMAYLALAAGDKWQLREFASEAVRWDPYYFNSRWLMAEALLADGDSPGAIREAELALALRPGSPEAKSVLRRASGGTRPSQVSGEALIERARICAERGDTAKSLDLLARAIRNSSGPCPACHRALALLYEGLNRYGDALAEWQTFAREASDPKSAEESAAHIAALKLRVSPL